MGIANRRDAVPDRENQDLEKGGVKYDLGKDRWDLLSWPAIGELVRVLTFGANKYRDHNWATGINYSRCLAACLRHITAWAQGEKIDAETGLNHLAHAICCLMFLLTYDLFPEKYKEYDDLYYYKEAAVTDLDTVMPHRQPELSATDWEDKHPPERYPNIPVEYVSKGRTDRT